MFDLSRILASPRINHYSFVEKIEKSSSEKDRDILSTADIEYKLGPYFGIFEPCPSSAWLRSRHAIEVHPQICQPISRATIGIM